MSEEYDEDCPECGFNQKDEDEKDEKEKQELISEFLEDLKSLEYIDTRKKGDHFPEFYIKVFDVQQLQEKWEAKKE